MRRGRPDWSQVAIALGVDDAHLAAGPDHAVFHVVVQAGTHRLGHCPVPGLLIFRWISSCIRAKSILILRRQTIDAVDFV